MEKRKRKREPSSSLRHADAYTISALMLAAISNFQNPYSKSLIKRCLNKLRLSLLSKPSNRPSSPQQTLPHPILSFLPVLLKSKCVEIASAAAEIVGTASLLSFEMNEIIALDCETVNAIVLAAVSSERRISLAACNAVLDLSTTSIGRERLLRLSAVETLMWEGFVQVALHSWNLKHKQLGDNESLEDSVCGNMKVMCVELLHVMMRIIGDYEPTFRKACLVCAVPLLSDTDGQKNIFSDLINKVNNSEESRLLEAVKCVQVAIEENKEDPFPWMSWIRHLNPMERCDLMMGKEALVLLFDQHKVEAEAAFMQVKSRFCSEVVFEDAVESYKLLLDKYKAARKQYMNGMLALHSN